MSERLYASTKALSKSPPAKLPPRRLDNIEYSEHFLRRIVQKNIVRSSIKHLPPNVHNDYLEHKKNLPLYLHRVTADLKRQKGTDKSLKELFSETPEQKPVIVFPNMSANPYISRNKSESQYKLPDDPINRKILQKIADAEPIDFFVIETPAEVEKKKPGFRLGQKPSLSPAEKVRSIITKKIEADMAERIDQCYKQYSKVQTIEKLRQFSTEKLKTAESSPEKSKPVLHTEGESIFSYNNPQARRLFTAQDDISREEVESKGNASISKEDEEEAAVMEICKSHNIKVADFFNMNEQEFFRKYEKLETKPREKHERPDTSPIKNVRGARGSKSQDNGRLFENTEALLFSEELTRPQKHIKNMFGYDDISKKREKDFLFDKFTIGRGMRLNSLLNPEKNSKRRQHMIMQTKYRKNNYWRNPQERISVETVTISTGEDPKLIKNTDKLAILFPKTAKALQTTAKWITSTPKTGENTEGDANRITFDDDDQQIIQKVLKGRSERHSILDSSTNDVTKSTISGWRPKTTTSSRIPANMNFVRIRQNQQEVREMQSLVTDFYEDLVTLTMDNQIETEKLQHELAQASTVVEAEYDKISEVNNKETVTTLGRDFRNLQKKNRFKHRLIDGVMNKVNDKKALVEEYERRMKEDVMQKALIRRNASMGHY